MADNVEAVIDVGDQRRRVGVAFGRTDAVSSRLDGGTALLGVVDQRFNDGELHRVGKRSVRRSCRHAVA